MRKYVYEKKCTRIFGILCPNARRTSLRSAMRTACSPSASAEAAQGLGTHLAKTVDTLHKPVAVLIGRTAESVAAMQGVLYAGGCYVPIDDHMPEARIRRIFEQVHPVAIVYAEGNRKQAEPLADCAPLISMDEGFAAPADADLLQSIRESVLDIDPVYLLFHLGFDR